MAEKTTKEMSGRERWIRALLFLAVAVYLAIAHDAAFKAIIGVSIVILVHELGHFWVAKASGIRVEVFSLGWGAPLVSYTHGDTRYQIAPIPLGGFMKPAGEFEEKEGENGVVRPHAQDEFLGKPWYVRALVLLAGPGMNFLAPLLALFVVYATLGRPFFIAPPLVTEVSPGSAAADAGIQSGDQIIKVDGQWVTDVGLLIHMVDAAAQAHPQEKTRLVLIHDGKQADVLAMPRLDPGAGRYRLGIGIKPGPAPQRKIIKRVIPSTPAENAGFKTGDEVIGVGGQLLKEGAGFPSLFASSTPDAQGKVTVELARAGRTLALSVPKDQPLPDGIDPKEVGVLGLEFEYNAELMGQSERQYERLGLLDSAKIASLEVAFRVRYMVQGIWQLVTGHVKLKESVSGPVAIARMAHQEAKSGVIELLFFMVNISLILGVMNLLPLPLLDGGTIVFCLIEGLRGKAVSGRTQAVLQNVSGALLLTLVLFVTYNDLGNLFRSMLNK